MGWSGTTVRPATEDDLPVLVALGEELREQLLPGVDVPLRGRGKGSMEARYREALDDPERHLVLAVGGGGEVLGMALLAVAPFTPLLDVPAVHMSHAVVADRHRRRGAGRALVAAAAAYAEDRGLEQVVVAVPPGSREANRFFARLGFAPLSVRRVASVGTVRRRLASADTATGTHLAVRRRVRRPSRSGAPAPVTALAASPAELERGPAA